MEKGGYMSEFAKKLSNFENEYDKNLKSKIKELLLLPTLEFDEVKNNARKKRNDSIGNIAYIRASLEIGNICNNKCKYCGMSCLNKELPRYKMSINEIKETIDKIRECGIKQLHLVSGKNQDSTEDIIACIKYARRRGLSVTTVLGEKNDIEYKQLYDAGASRYIMKFETSNSNIFQFSKPGDELSNRLSHILKLRELGYMIGTGTIVGLPGTTIDDLSNDLVLLKKINPNMASCSTFSPNKQSEYKNCKAGSKELTLRFISLMRLFLQDRIYIPSSSSLGFNGQVEALNAGANVISVHFTPEKYSDLFSMYKSSNRIKRQLEEIKLIMEATHMEIGEYI